MSPRSATQPSPPSAQAASGDPLDEAVAAPRVVTSDALLCGASQLAIVHERTVYFLRRTRLGKLILTK